MGAASEGEVAVGVAGDVELCWVIKDFRITICGTDAEVEVGACGDFVCA